MPMERFLDERDLERAVLAYLAGCPHAMDTFKNIATWWVRQQVIRFDLEALDLVLDRLTQQGVVERVPAVADGGSMYRLMAV